MGRVVEIGLPQFQALLLILMRVGGILAAWPVLGSRMIPMKIKTGLALMLALVLLPLVRMPALPDDAAGLTSGTVGEFLIGLVIGLAVRFLFAGVELAGEVMGSQMGLSVVQLFDPSTAHQTPLLGQFQTFLATLVFLSIDAHVVAVQAIAHSFEVIPPFGAGLSPALTDDVLRISQGMFVVALKLAAPVLATVLLVNLGMAVLGRSVPQINVFVLSFPITIAVGFVVLGGALPYVVELEVSEFERLFDTVHGLMRALGR